MFTEVLTEKGRPYTHMRFRQEDPAPNAYPYMVELNTPYPINVRINILD